MQQNVTTQISNLTSQLYNLLIVGAPQLSLDGVLPTNCIWLEGAEVSRTTYKSLFDIYGTTYGEGDGSTTFNLPDFREKTLWGATDLGYIDAGLPNITGGYIHPGWEGHDYWGAVWGGYTTNYYVGTDKGWGATNGMKFDASKSNKIYGNSTTVQPPAIKVRVYTRYQ